MKIENLLSENIFLLPANEKVYDYKQNLKDHDNCIDWRIKSKQINKNDLVLIYFSKPTSSITMVTKVININVNKSDIIDDEKYWVNGKVDKKTCDRYVRLKLLYELKNEIALYELRNHNLKGNIQSFRKVDGLLKQFIVNRILDDYNLKKNIDEIKSLDNSKIEYGESNLKYLKRDSNKVNIALKNANYLCEFNTSHKSFIRAKDNNNYTEAHHLIPLSAQKDFNNIPLDIIENIVSLCPNCHREIHYGCDNKKIIEKLYIQRKDALASKGIYITLAQLFSYYSR